MHQKVDPWGGQHHCQCPLEQLIGMDQFKSALAKESPEVKGDIALVNKLIIKVWIFLKTYFFKNEPLIR